MQNAAALLRRFSDIFVFLRDKTPAFIAGQGKIGNAVRETLIFIIVIGVKRIIAHSFSPDVFILSGRFAGRHSNSGQEFFRTVIFLPFQQNETVARGLCKKVLYTPFCHFRAGKNRLQHQMRQNRLSAPVHQSNQRIDAGMSLIIRKVIEFVQNPAFLVVILKIHNADSSDFWHRLSLSVRPLIFLTAKSTCEFRQRGLFAENKALDRTTFLWVVSSGRCRFQTIRPL